MSAETSWQKWPLLLTRWLLETQAAVATTSNAQLQSEHDHHQNQDIQVMDMINVTSCISILFSYAYFCALCCLWFASPPAAVNNHGGHFHENNGRCEDDPSSWCSLYTGERSPDPTQYRCPVQIATDGMMAVWYIYIVLPDLFGIFCCYCTWRFFCRSSSFCLSIIRYNCSNTIQYYITVLVLHYYCCRVREVTDNIIVLAIRQCVSWASTFITHWHSRKEAKSLSIRYCIASLYSIVFQINGCKNKGTWYIRRNVNER